jgi:cysteine desulfurase
MRIYLDHNATTPVRDEVVEAMVDVLRHHHGNPSSTHAEGSAARRLLERAREQVAGLLSVEPDEVIFTGSATESNNTVLAMAVNEGRGRHVVTTSVEHPSVEEPLVVLARSEAIEVTRVAVDAQGRVDPDAVRAALRDDTAVVSILLANNETGVLQDVSALAAVAAERSVPVHVDATQAVGKIPIDVAALGARWLVGSAHKFNGPKGAGFLVARGAPVQPYLHGGPQEKRRRGGTENLAGIVGLGAACALAEAELAERTRHVSTLRDRLWDGIRKGIDDVVRNGDPEHVLPNTLNVGFGGTAGEILLEVLDGEGVAVSAGAACHSGSLDPSHVLTAMGRTPEEARGCLRFSVGPGNTVEEIDRVLAMLPELVARVRAVPL